MAKSYTPNYSHANNVKYYLEGVSARRWCYENQASYSSFWRLKKEGRTDEEIISHLKERYIDRISENSVHDIAAYLRKLYLKTIRNNESIHWLKKWFFSRELNAEVKEKAWDMATTSQVVESNDIEVWKKIEETKNYYISNYGNFRKKTNNEILRYFYPKPYPKQKNNRKKEPNRITMHIKLDNKEYSAAKLVATYFVSNPGKYKYTYILDGNPRNLRYDNIKWVSKSELGKLTGYRSKSKPVRVRTKRNKDFKEFRSVRSAAKYLNVSYQTLLDYIKKSTRPKNSVLKKYVIEYI